MLKLHQETGVIDVHLFYEYNASNHTYISFNIGGLVFLPASVAGYSCELERVRCLQDVQSGGIISGIPVVRFGLASRLALKS
jgi:hypothetical protein